MNSIKLVWAYMKARPLNTSMNVLLMALSIAVVTILIQFSNQVTERMTANARGIDLVVGAKGSPLQLILCSVFHIDFPTGNIRLSEASRISENSLVKQAIPVSVGDNYRGHRIVGTTKQYADLYNASLTKGVWFENEMEVVVGASVAKAAGLSVGDTFESAHGLSEQGHSHETEFIVKGVMSKTNSVVDDLIMTPLESVWHVHEEDGEDHHGPIADSLREITSLLIRYRSPVAALQLPRYINSRTGLQAASPAFEISRLFSIMGLGLDVLTGFAYVLIFISMLSIFVTLYNSLLDRRYDLAVMRTMGASPFRLMTSVVLEGCSLTFMGAAVGLILGHFMLLVFISVSGEAERFGLDAFRTYASEWTMLAASIVTGIFSSIGPALQVYRIDIHKTLAVNS